MRAVSAAEARDILLSGVQPSEDFSVEGVVDLSNETRLTTLPDQFRSAWELNVSGCTNLTRLPHGFEAHRLILNDCTALKTLPPALKANSLQAAKAGLETLPDDLNVSYKLDLTGCTALTQLPRTLRVGSLVITGCTALEALPDELHIFFLNAANCTRLERWGERGSVQVGKIDLRNCTRLTYLPDWLTPLDTLNVSGCTRLNELPDSLAVTSIELAESGLTSLPPSLTPKEIRWRDVLIDGRIAFQPETITSREILDELNVEVRRVMLDRMGYEAFLKQAHAQERDRDFDAGGVRKLLCINFQSRRNQPADEPLVCLSVICPSTARQYIIRVPPTMQTCHQAAAWIAGFDDAGQYHPIRET